MINGVRLHPALSLFLWMADFLLPFLAGPVAASVFLGILEKKHTRRLWKFWLGLIVVNLLWLVMMSVSTWDFWGGPAFLSCLSTPAYLIATIFVLRASPLRKEMAEELDDWQDRNLTAGSLYIPLLLLVTPFIYTLISPWLCAIGARLCSSLG